MIAFKTSLLIEVPETADVKFRSPSLYGCGRSNLRDRYKSSQMKPTMSARVDTTGVHTRDLDGITPGNS